MLNMQNVKDIEITEGKVRTIHDKDNRLIWGRLSYDTKYVGDTSQNGTPTPDVPILVQTVAGAQTVTIGDGVNSQDYTVNLTSKNLFSSVLEIGGINAGGQAMNQTTRLDSKDFINVQPNTTYTFSAIPKVAGKTINVYFNGYKEDGTLIANLPANAWRTPPVTFTTPANCSKIKMSGRYYDDSSFGTVGTVTDAFQNVQLEEGNEATTYAPYYNYELCKIGDYQDYIYKSGDDWYVHKAIGKMMMGDITTVWGKFSNGNYYNTYFASTYGFMNATTYSNIFTYNSTSWAGDGKFGINATGALWIMTGDSSLDNVSNVPTWLQNKNAIMYGVLATPTDTKITDATLIGQLNAVHEWLTRYGYNATVTGNLPIIINQTNL